MREHGGSRCFGQGPRYRAARPTEHTLQTSATPPYPSPKPPAQHTPHNTTAHGTTPTPSLCPPPHAPLLQPCTTLHTTSSVGIGSAKTMVPEKTQKCGNIGPPCLDKPVLRQRGGTYAPGIGDRAPPMCGYQRCMPRTSECLRLALPPFPAPLVSPGRIGSPITFGE